MIQTCLYGTDEKDMELLDRQCEKFMGGPTVPHGERVHVTISPKGTIFLNAKAHKMIGSPAAVYLYFNRPKDMIILEPTPALTASNAFQVRESLGTGRNIWANPFCKHFGIRVPSVEKFIAPEVDSVGRMYLKLSETIAVPRGPRGPRKKNYATGSAGTCLATANYPSTFLTWSKSAELNENGSNLEAFATANQNKDMNTFSVNAATASMILSEFKEYLKSTDSKNDRVYDMCLTQLQTLDVAQFQKLFETVYDASMRREEGRHHRFSVVLTPSIVSLVREISPRSGALYSVSVFERPIPITNLPKIAPAFENTNQSLRVWFSESGDLEIWGFAQGFLDSYGLKIQPLSLGELLIDIKSLDFPQARFLMTFSETRLVQRETPIGGLLRKVGRSATESAENFDKFEEDRYRSRKIFGFIVDVVNRMSSHGHGGTILFVPTENREIVLDRSIKKDVRLKPSGGYRFIRDRLNLEVKEHMHSMRSERKNTSLPWSFDKEAGLLGQMTSVDGATVVTTDFEILAIGAKIKETDVIGSSQINIWVTNAYKDAQPIEFAVSDLGGTRHQSAAHFVYDNRAENAFAVVASQDGKLSILYWDETTHRLNCFTHAEYSYHGLKYSDWL